MRIEGHCRVVSARSSLQVIGWSASAVMIAALCACTGAHNGWSGSSSVSAASSAPMVTQPKLTTQRARQLGADLAAGEQTRVRDAVALPAGTALPAATLKQLSGLGLSIDASTYQQTGASTATVSARTKQGQWLVYLSRVSDRWMITATEPAR